MLVEIKLKKKHFAITALICLVLLAGFVVANQDIVLKLAGPNPESIPLPGRLVGHSSEDIAVNLSGSGSCSGDISLQDAIDNECFGGGMSLGELTPRNFNQVYGPAATDGFVFASTNWAYLNVYKGDSAANLAVVSKEAPAAQGPQSSWGSITMPVKKGEYWKVDGSSDSPPMVYWVPIISGSSGSEITLPTCSDGQFLEASSGSWVCADAPSGSAFGNWIDVTATASDGTVHGPAATGGFVVIGTDDWGKINAFTDSDNPPTRRLVYNSRDSVNEKQFTMPVRKGDYWKVEGTSISSVYWISLVEGDSSGGSVWNSGWFACSTGETYPDDLSGGIFPNGNHNLGTQDLIVQVWFAADNSGSPDLSNVYQVQQHYDFWYYGAWVNVISNTQLKVTTASGGVYILPDSTGTFANGHCRVIAIAD